MPTLYQSLLKYNNSDVKALYFEGNSYTFKQLLVRVRQAAAYLKDKGIHKGDVVTTVLPNLPITVYLFYALDAIGAVQNIVHPLTPAEKILETMTETGSRHAILLETLYGENRQLFEGSEHTFFFVNPMYDKSPLHRRLFYLKYKRARESERIFKADKFRAYPEEHCIEHRDERENSVYLHSGGTTGVPKVIALSDASLNNLAAKVDGIIEGDVKGRSMLAVLPSFHGFGLGMGIHAPLYNHAASALMMKFDCKKVVRWINQNKVNMIIGVPLLYQKLLKDGGFLDARLENLDYCFIGGDNVPPSLISEFNDVMRSHRSGAMLLEGYGLTETVTVCCVNTKAAFKDGSVGRPLRGIDITVRDSQLRSLPAAVTGEVYVKGDTLMNEYLSDPQATGMTLVDIDGESCVRTGDLGYLDGDGFLFLKGRMKRVFKISGINVYPSEVEKIATDNEDIIDAAMEFFEEPKPHTVLFVIKSKNTTKTDAQITEEVTAQLTQRLLKYSLPSKLVFMETFPKTNVGKTDHKAFRE